MFKRTLSALSAATVALMSMSASAQTFAPDPFTDVPEGSAYFEAVEHLRTKNVLKGYEDGTYRPSARINRAEFVKLIANPYILDTERLNDCIGEEIDEDDQTVFFPDVRRDFWYAPEVCLAKTQRLIDGYPDGTFKPGEYISFVEAAKILSNTFVLQTEPEPENEKWYEKYVKKLDEENAIPMSIKRFDQPITRGEMAEMLFRLKTGNDSKASQSFGNIR
jgi:hypothetical protein